MGEVRDKIDAVMRSRRELLPIIANEIDWCTWLPVGFQNTVRAADQW